jgi:hypothetical protein
VETVVGAEIIGKAFIFSKKPLKNLLFFLFLRVIANAFEKSNALPPPQEKIQSNLLIFV